METDYIMAFDSTEPSHIELFCLAQEQQAVICELGARWMRKLPCVMTDIPASSMGTAVDVGLIGSLGHGSTRIGVDL